MSLASKFMVGTPCAKGNHTITNIGNSVAYLLHGHVIVQWTPGEGIELRHAGYATVTTAKAINALLKEMPWLPFTLKAWTLTDTRTGRVVPFPADGSPVRLTRDPERLSLAQHGMGASAWFFADEVSASIAPTIGGK